MDGGSAWCPARERCGFGNRRQCQYRARPGGPRRTDHRLGVGVSRHRAPPDFVYRRQVPAGDQGNLGQRGRARRPFAAARSLCRGGPQCRDRGPHRLQIGGPPACRSRNLAGRQGAVTFAVAGRRGRAVLGCCRHRADGAGAATGPDLYRARGDRERDPVRDRARTRPPRPESQRRSPAPPRSSGAR